MVVKAEEKVKEKVDEKIDEKFDENFDETDVVTDNLVEAKRIIKNRVITSVALGLVPLPLVDVVGLTGIQLEMVSKLARLYDVPFRKNIGKSLIASLVGGVLPASMMSGTFSLLKAVPIIGWTTGAVAMGGLGGATTYAVGKVFVQHFEAGGNLLNFDPEAMKEYFAQQFEEGKKVASAAKR